MKRVFRSCKPIITGPVVGAPISILIRKSKIAPAERHTRPSLYGFFRYLLISMYWALYPTVPLQTAI